MRIDYFIVSEQLKDRIISCEMHGRGIELEGKKLKWYLTFFMFCYTSQNSGGSHSNQFSATYFIFISSPVDVQKVILLFFL